VKESYLPFLHLSRFSSWMVIFPHVTTCNHCPIQVGADEARMAAGGRESWMLDAPTDKGGSFLDELKKQGAPTKRGFTQMVGLDIMFILHTFYVEEKGRETSTSEITL